MAVLDRSITVSTGPLSEPLTTAEAKTHLRVSGSSEDAYIDDLVEVARKQVEHDARMACFTQTIEERFNAFPPSTETFLELAIWPLQSVTSITYLDTSQASQTWTSSLYEVDDKRRPPVIWLTYNEDWPDTTPGLQNSVVVTYVAGYTTVPEEVRQPVRLLVAHMFEQREPALIKPMHELPLAYHAMIARLHPGTYP